MTRSLHKLAPPLRRSELALTQRLPRRAYAAAQAPPPDSKGQESAAPQTPAQKDEVAPEVKVVHVEQSSSRLRPLVGMIALAGGGAGVWWYLQTPAPTSEPSKAERQQLREAEERAAAEAAEAAKVARQKREEEEEAAKAAAEKAAHAERLAAQEREEAQARAQEATANLQSALQKASEEGLPAMEVLAMALAAAMAESQSEVRTEHTELFAAASDRLHQLRKLKEFAEVSAHVDLALEAALTQRSSSAVREALGEIDSHKKELVDLGEPEPADSEIVAKARVQVVALEQIEREAEMRRLAAVELKDAISSRDAERCKTALAEAKQVGVEPGPDFEIARIISNPALFHEVLQQVKDDRLSNCKSAAAAIQTLTVQDFVQAAKADLASLNEEELRARAAQLASALVAHHLVAAKELAEAVGDAEKELAERCANRAEVATQNLSSDLRSAAQAQQEAIIDEADRRRAATDVQVRAEARKQAEGRRAAAASRAEEEVIETLSSEARNFAARRRELEEGVLAGVEQIFLRGLTPRQRVQAAGLLSTSVMDLEAALLSGRPCYEALKALEARNSELAGVLLKLLPTDMEEKSREAIPTKAQLRKDFHQSLPRLVTSALTPPARGLAGKLLSGLVGSVLGRLYVVKALPAKAPSQEQGITAEVERNLEALGRAAILVDQGNLYDALELLQASLQGHCRDSAEAWMAATRSALLLHQTVKAVNAEACCVIASV